MIQLSRPLNGYSGFVIVLLIIVVIWWVNSASQSAAQRTAQAASVAMDEAVAHTVNQMQPLVDIVVASWLEARRWRRQLEELGHQPFMDHTLTANARRSAQRFHEVSKVGTVPSTSRSISEILEYLLADEIRPVAHLVGTVQLVAPAPLAAAPAPLAVTPAPLAVVPAPRPVHETRKVSTPPPTPATTAAKKREALAAEKVELSHEESNDAEVQTLVARLESRDVTIRTAAAIELRELNDDAAAVRGLVNALGRQVFVSEDDFDFAHEALKTLESALRYCDEIPDELKVATVAVCSRLLETLLPPVSDDDDAPHEDLYMQLCDVFEVDALLEHVEPALPVFRRLLRNQPGHPHANWLMLTLGKIGGAEDGALLVELLSHPTNSIMSNAAWALEAMRFTGAGPALRRVLQSGRHLGWGRAMNALIALHDPETIARMSEHLNAKEAVDIASFLDAVEKHALTEIAPVLVQKAADSNWLKSKSGSWRDPEHLRADLLRVAANFGDKTAVEQLRAMANNVAVSPLARSCAAVSLMKVGELAYAGVAVDCIPRCWDSRGGGGSPLARVLYVLNEIHLLRRVPAEHADAVARLVVRGQDDRLLWRAR